MTYISTSLQDYGIKPWANVKQVIVAGQSNAVNVMNSTPTPIAPTGAALAYVCQGGTSLKVHWQPGYQYHLRENLISAVATAPAGKIAVLWIQGESDQDALESASSYVANFASLKTDVEGSRAADVLWLITYISSVTKYGYQPSMRVGQQQIVGALPRVMAINTDGYAIQTTGIGDGLGVHYQNSACVQCWQDALTLMSSLTPTIEP